MKKIIGSMFISALGITLVFAGQDTAASYDNSRPGLMVIGGILQIVAFAVFLHGLREFFLDGITEELKRITRKLSRDDYAAPELSGPAVKP